MLLDYIRVFLKIGAAALVDNSLQNQNDASTTLLALDGSSYIYVAQRLPFTNLFLYSDVANAVAANLGVQYWDGTTWRDAVDVLDGTSDMGATLAKSGCVQWSLDALYSWQMVSRTDQNPSPTELQGLKIYNSYWVRLKVDATITATTALKEIGYAFTTSQELNRIDVEIDSFMPAFRVGKTDWIKEILTASKMLVTDLKVQGLIVAPGQIIEIDDVYLPTTYKTLEVIYFSLGPSYADKRKEIRASYYKALNLRRFTFDSNGDGRLEKKEIHNQIKKLVR